MRGGVWQAIGRRTSTRSSASVALISSSANGTSPVGGAVPGAPPPPGHKRYAGYEVPAINEIGKGSNQARADALDLFLDGKIRVPLAVRGKL